MNSPTSSAPQVLQGRDFSPALAQAWIDLMQAVWPSADGPRSLDDSLDSLHHQDALHFMRLSPNPSRMLCHAALFARDMASEGRAFRVGCLAGVCVRPELRGQGWGREVVRAAFDALPQVAPVVLFQTGVPTFYERLGARQISSRLVNARSAEPERNPFWDAFAMIYPGDYDWPESTVDIGGGGF